MRALSGGVLMLNWGTECSQQKHKVCPNTSMMNALQGKSKMKQRREVCIKRVWNEEC